MAYTKEIWDQIYMEHCEDAPWMLEEYSDQVQYHLDKMIDNDKKGQRILEYGCGNGKVAMHFQKLGMYVDMADISHVLIQYLRKKYEGSGMGIFEVETPFVLGGRLYDIIIVWCVLHHIDPKEWNYYLEGFYQIMKVGGTLIIGGWDYTDTIIFRDNNVALYTQRETWFINPISGMIDTLKFTIVNSNVISIKNPLFDDTRKIRYFKLTKNQLL